MSSKAAAAKRLEESGEHEIDGELFDDALPYEDDIEARVVVTMFQTRPREEIYAAAGMDGVPLTKSRGYDNSALMSFEEIGALMGLSRQRVEQIESVAMEKVRKRLHWSRQYESLRELMTLRESLRGESLWDKAERDSMVGGTGYGDWNNKNSMRDIEKRSGRAREPNGIVLSRFEPKGAW
jgi:hypothetical protein